MKRRPFLTALAATLAAPLAFLKLSDRKFHRDYVRACKEAGIPKDEIGRVIVVEIQQESRPGGTSLVIVGDSLDASGVIRPIPKLRRTPEKVVTWKAAPFDDIRKDDVFRSISTRGYEMDPKTKQPRVLRATTDVEPDFKDRINSVLLCEPVLV